MAVIDNTNQGLLENQAFVARIESKQGLDKAASAMTDFIRIKIREVGFTRKILPPKFVTATDLDRSVDSDQPRRIVEMDKISEAYPVTYLEKSQQRYYTGRKFEVFYKKIMSEEFMKPTTEIMTYRTPIKTIVQENYLKDIQIAEDKGFITAVDEIIAKKEAEAPGTSKYTVAGPFTTKILAEGLKLMAAKEIPMGTILINEVDFMDLYKQENTAVGSLVSEDIIANGYSYTKLLGHTFIRTIKQDVVKPGNIYLFTTPDYLGVFDILTDTKAFMKQEADNLQFYLWEHVGIAIGNTNGVAKISLT